MQDLLRFFMLDLVYDGGIKFLIIEAQAERFFHIQKQIDQ